MWKESRTKPWECVHVGADWIEQRGSEGENFGGQRPAMFKCDRTHVQKVYDEESHGHLPMGVLSR